MKPSEVDTVCTIIDSNLPAEFHGWPVYFGWDEIAVQHHVSVVPLGKWLELHLGFDPQVDITVQNWLTTPQQLMLEVTAGAIFHDPDGDLKRVRSKLEWHPNDRRISIGGFISDEQFIHFKRFWDYPHNNYNSEFVPHCQSVSRLHLLQLFVN